MRSNVGGLGRRWFLAGMIIATAVVLSLFVNTTEGAHPLPSLLYSNFEIDYDANLTVEHTAPPSLDWASASVIEDRQDDLDSGSKDDSFGKGTKEDTAVPERVTGSIPPNKSDLRAFGVYLEENPDGKFMHLFWTRAQDPNGTTNMDFEFNQSTVISTNLVTPIRTGGDLLLEYKLSKGGTVPDLFLYTWLDESGDVTNCVAASSVPCWGAPQNLTSSGEATGSVNATAIAAENSDGLGDLDPFTFGEASVDLAAIFDPTKCQSFGSAYLKSRSSDSFTAALKDYIAPQPINITNCGTVIIRKNTVPSGAPIIFDFTSKPKLR